jgi:hypothetical protein
MALLIQKLEIMSGSSLTNVMIWRPAGEDFICDFETVILYCIIVNKVLNLVFFFSSFIAMIVCHPNRAVGT